MFIGLTEEEINQSILSAYNSVDVINQLNAQPSLTQEEEETLSRNKEHIKIMLKKDWFVAGLTIEQKAELEAI